MSVAPRPANDGQHPTPSSVTSPSEPGKGAEANVDGAADKVGHSSGFGESTDLPPTLFQLPALNATAPEPKPTAANDNKPTPEADHTDPQAAEHAEHSAAIPSTIDSTAPTQPGDAGQQPETPLAAKKTSGPSDKPNPEYRPVDPVPTGRTWMEQIGSHSLVVTMLLIVVAAALLTGRRTEDANESQVADAESLEDGLEYESRDDSELPLGPHRHTHAGLSGDSVSERSEVASIASQSAPTAGENQPVANSAQSSAAELPSWLSDAPLTPPEPSAATSVALKKPEIFADPSGMDADADSSRSTQSPINENPYFSGSTPLDVQPAATRTTDGALLTTDEAVLTTDEALLPADQAGAPAGPSAAAGGVRFTRTPFAVTDWISAARDIFPGQFDPQATTAASEIDSSSSN